MGSDVFHDSDALEQQVRKKIELLSYLPTTTAVAMKFVELGRDPGANPTDYARLIESDASLSCKLLALANSSWFGVRNQVTSPQVAITLLGLATVRTLALSYCLTGLNHDLKLSAAETEGFWSAALCKAVAARQYARRIQPAIADQAFTAGLFQDFAIPVMYAVAKSAGRALPDGTVNAATRLEMERKMFRLDHAELGRLIAEKLELPEPFADLVGFHHRYPLLREVLGDAGLADATYVASLFGHTVDLCNTADASELHGFVGERNVIHDVATFLNEVEAEYANVYSYVMSARPRQ